MAHSVRARWSSARMKTMLGLAAAAEARECPGEPAAPVAAATAQAIKTTATSRYRRPRSRSRNGRRLVSRAALIGLDLSNVSPLGESETLCQIGAKHQGPPEPE